MMRFGFLILIVLLINLLLVSTPAVLFNLPITQTDGASHYVYAKIFSETLDINSPNPEYNRIGSAEKIISDYPPFVTIFFGLLLRVFGSDIFFINGGIGLIFFLIASVSIYFFTRDLTKNKMIALMVLLFFVLNVRAYYTLFTGIYPAFVAFCLSITALYFAFRFLSKNKNSDLFLTIVLTALTTFAYSVQGLYLIFLEFNLWVGMGLEKRIDVKFPKLGFKLNLSKIRFRKIIYVIVPGILFFVLVFFKFSLTARSPWVDEWFSGLLSGCPGYPCVWKYFFIVDNLLLVSLAIVGAFYLFTKKNWTILSLVFGGFLIIFSGNMLFEGAGIVYFIYRFYTTFFVLLLLPACIFIYSIIKKNKNIGILILIAALVVQFAMVGFFFGKIGPAITAEEYDASQELLKYRESKILYINNENELGNFKAFKWIIVFAKSDDYQLMKEMPDDLDYDYIFIKNTENLSDEDREKIKDFQLVFDGSKTGVYKIR